MIFEILIVVAAATILIVLSRRLPETVDVAVKSGLPGEIRQSGIGKYAASFKASIVNLIKKLRLPKFNIKLNLPKIGVKNKKSVDVLTESSLLEQSGDLMLEADMALQQGNLREAEEKYLQLAKKASKNDKVYSRLGVIYLKQKNFADARDAFLATLKINDRIASRHYNLAITYIALGAIQKAKVSLKRAIELDPAKEKFQRTLNNLNQEKTDS